VYIECIPGIIKTKLALEISHHAPAPNSRRLPAWVEIDGSFSLSPAGSLLFDDLIDYKHSVVGSRGVV
jgi:hypothetical protein